MDRPTNREAPTSPSAAGRGVVTGTSGSMAVRRMRGKLTPELVAKATRIGRERHASLGLPMRLVERDIADALAEQVLALALNREWKGAFVSVDKWKVWKKLQLDVASIRVCRTNFAAGAVTVEESDPDDMAIVLVMDRDSPEFTVVGWVLAKDAKKDEYRSDTLGPPCFHVPQDQLRACWDLRLAPEGSRGGERKRDPAPDFAGHGRFPQRRYDDDGRHPSKYGNLITSRFALPCCRCQTIIPAGALTGGNLVTGTIHGDPKDCRKGRERSK